MIKQKQTTFVSNCPNCYGGPLGRCLCFPWDNETPKNEGDRRILGDYDVYRRSIKLKQRMQYGSLWQCSNCETHWFLTPDEKWMHFLEEDCLPFVLNWVDFDYCLPEDYLANISALGPTLRDESSFGKKAVELPCRVILKDGSILDPALLSFSTMPPVRTLGAGISLLSLASEITASDFALPKEIRFATRLAEWRSKSPDPVFVRSNNWTRFEFIHEHDFFKHPIVKANELQLAPPTFSRDEKYEQPKPALVAGKWTEPIEEILLQLFREFKKEYKPLT